MTLIPAFAPKSTHEHWYSTSGPAPITSPWVPPAYSKWTVQAQPPWATPGSGRLNISPLQRTYIEWEMHLAADASTPGFVWRLHVVLRRPGKQNIVLNDTWAESPGVEHTLRVSDERGYVHRIDFTYTVAFGTRTADSFIHVESLGSPN